MMNEVQIVKDFYDQNAEYEWQRCERHPFEFAINKAYLDRYIKPGESVLDIGGGPGRYSLYLAEKGCKVTLAELSEGNVRLAEKKAEEQNLKIKAMVCDAREIDSLITEQFDHVLLMGPLYHLREEKDRIRSIEASMKLLKPGGLLYTAFISANAGVIYMAQYEPKLILEDAEQPELKAMLQNEPFSGESFTNAYYSRVQDILPFMNKFSLQKLHLLSSEGILAPFEGKITSQSPEIKKAWIDYALQICEREDLLSYAEHLLYIGRKI